jgi:hypothetical protein
VPVSARPEGAEPAVVDVVATSVDVELAPAVVGVGVELDGGTSAWA